jgi:hypothetical protein
MQMIKLSMMLLWMIFLSSCKTKIICAQINSAKIKPVMIYDVSFQFNRCRGRCLDVNKWETVPLNQCSGTQEDLGDSVNFPLESCEGIAGFPFDDIANNIRPNIKKLDAIKEDYCK